VSYSREEFEAAVAYFDGKPPDLYVAQQGDTDRHPDPSHSAEALGIVTVEEFAAVDGSAVATPHARAGNGHRGRSQTHCSRCRAELTPADKRQSRKACSACRNAAERERQLEREAEQAWRFAPRPRPCGCERPLLVVTAPDLDVRCLLCGRTR